MNILTIEDKIKINIINILNDVIDSIPKKLFNNANILLF